MVLLKNDGLLPIKGDPKSIAVIGPNADATDVLEGNYNGTPIRPVTVLAGIKARWPKAKVAYAQGVGLVGPIKEAVPDSAFCRDAACSKKGVSTKVFAGAKAEGKPTATRSDAAPLVAARDRDVAAPNTTTEWTGFIRAPESGAYRFDFSGFSGYALWVDGKLVRQESADQSVPSTGAGTVTLSGGKAYSFRLVASQQDRRDVQKLSWTLPHMNGDDAVRGGEGGGSGDLRRRPVTPASRAKKCASKPRASSAATAPLSTCPNRRKPCSSASRPPTSRWSSC